MKTHLLLPLILSGCVIIAACSSTGQLTPQGAAVINAAKPIADAAIVAAAAHYGVPPSSSTAVIAAVDSIWGAYVQAQRGQPVDQGATVPAIGRAISSNVPADATPAQATAMLQAAANVLTAK